MTGAPSDSPPPRDCRDPSGGEPPSADCLRVRGPALHAARNIEPATPADRKLAMVQEAAALEYPTADPDQMEAEIARGYGAETG